MVAEEEAWAIHPAQTEEVLVAAVPVVSMMDLWLGAVEEAVLELAEVEEREALSTAEEVVEVSEAEEEEEELLHRD